MAKTRERRPGRPGRKKAVIAVIVLALLAGAFFGYKKVMSKRSVTDTASQVSTDMVERGDVSLTITGSAAVEPYERYEIIPKVSGDIISCGYEIGDVVQKGAVLYKFDTSSNDISMQKQQLSLEESQINYQNALKDREKLSITADAEGVISNLAVKEGDEVKNGAKIADINNTKVLEVELPFNESQAASIKVGDAAYVSSSVHMSNVAGTVTHKDANFHAGSDSARMYNVTIQFENPGAFYDGMTVGGAVGDMISSGSGTVKQSDSGSAAAEAEGKITRVYYANGDYVKKGAVIAAISSDTISDSIKKSETSYENAKLSMQDAQEKLEDYSLTSPISGTVITKNAKAGDTIDKTNSTQTLMVVADVSKLKFSLEIDELDVSKVSAGQKVEITCDALPGEEYEGEITKLSVEGTSSNGVTTYTAEVVINEPGNLRPSMNIDASVVAQYSENTLYIPSEDVKTLGNTYYVFKKSDSAASDGEPADGGQAARGKRPGGENGEGMRPRGEGSDSGNRGEQRRMPDDVHENTGGQRPEGAPENMPGGESGAGGSRRLPPAPDGFVSVEVTVGVVGDEYTEILSGLSEGDEVYTQTSSSTHSNNMMGGMPGGMGGGMPGGMGGGPGGGMGGGPR